MSIKRGGRSGLSRYSIGYGLDYGLKHKPGLDPYQNENYDLLQDRDPELIIRNARAITVTSDNCNAYDPEAEFKLTRKMWDKNKPKNQAATFILASSDENWAELGKFIADRDYKGVLSKVREIDKYREWGQMSLEVAELIAGNGDAKKGKEEYQIAVQTHADERGKHAHVEINTLNLVDGKKMNYDHDELIKIYGYADKVYESRGLTVQQAGLERILNPDTGKYITQRKGGYTATKQGSIVDSMVKKGRYSYIDDLNFQFEAVLSQAKSKNDAVKELLKRGISIDQWSDNRKYIKAHWNELKVDVKSHGKLSQRKGTPSKSIRLKNYTREEAENELALAPEQRIKTLSNLANRKKMYDKYGRIIDISPTVSALTERNTNTATEISRIAEQISKSVSLNQDTIRNIDRYHKTDLQQSKGKRKTEALERPVSRPLSNTHAYTRSTKNLDDGKSISKATRSARTVPRRSQPTVKHISPNKNQQKITKEQAIAQITQTIKSKTLQKVAIQMLTSEKDGSYNVQKAIHKANIRLQTHYRAQQRFR